MQFSEWLFSQIWSLPFLLVYSAGIVLSVGFWKRHPMVSLLALTAFLTFFGLLLLNVGLQYWRFVAHDDGEASNQFGTVFQVAQLLTVVLGTMAWALLLTALFGWRSAPKLQEKTM